MIEHLQLDADEFGEPVAWENGAAIPVMVADESQGGPGDEEFIHGDNVRLLVDLLTVYLESKPRRDQALPAWCALAVMFSAPGLESAEEISRKLGNVSPAAISRAKSRLIELVTKKSGRLPVY